MMMHSQETSRVDQWKCTWTNGETLFLQHIQYTFGIYGFFATSVQAAE
jgi:hypothetical protein